MEPESEETEDKMSNFALHTRLHKIELIIYRAGAIGLMIRFLIRIAHSGIIG